MITFSLDCELMWGIPDAVNKDYIKNNVAHSNKSLDKILNLWEGKCQDLSLAFVIASFFVGIAGALFAHYLGTINPHQFGVGIMVFVLVWVIVGGTKTFTGPIIGVTVLSVLNELFRGTDELRPAIYGCILIASIMFLPEGLESVPHKLREAINRRRGLEMEEEH